MWKAAFERSDEMEVVGVVEDGFGEDGEEGEEDVVGSGSAVILNVGRTRKEGEEMEKEKEDEGSKKKKKKKKSKKKRKIEEEKEEHEEKEGEETEDGKGGKKRIKINDGDVDVGVGKGEDKIKKKKKKKKKRKKEGEEGKGVDDDVNDDDGSNNKLNSVKSQTSPPSSQPTQSTNSSATSPSPNFPYPVDENDHCESPTIAYTHITSLLKSVIPGNSNPTIYDPYYCDGSVKSNLNDLGFTKVEHEKVDCYSVWSTGATPPHDVFVTNPPYSSDHVSRLMSHLCAGPGSGKPWFLLMPQYVHKHEYYASLTSTIRPFYIVPSKRYVYVPPKGFREGGRKSGVHKKNSPFVSMWFCWGGDEGRNRKLIEKAKRGEGMGYKVAVSKSGLRDLRRKGKK